MPISFILPVFLLVAQAAPTTGESFVCRGGGTSATPVQVLAVAAGRDRAGFDTRVRQESYEGEARIELTGDAGRVQPPRIMLPPVREGDKGWFDLRNVAASSDRTTARFTVNFANRPSLTFDRQARTLTIDARDWSYAGSCVPA